MGKHDTTSLLYIPPAKIRLRLKAMFPLLSGIPELPQHPTALEPLISAHTPGIKFGKCVGRPHCGSGTVLSNFKKPSLCDLQFGSAGELVPQKFTARTVITVCGDSWIYACLIFTSLDFVNSVAVNKMAGDKIIQYIVSFTCLSSAGPENNVTKKTPP